MDHFNYHQGELFAEEVAMQEIAARFGTPLYCYSRATIERHYRAFAAALSSVDHLVCYAVKANSNIAILHLMARLGAGFDIVSVGELERVLAAGGDASKVIFSGVGKRVDEIALALEVEIHCFNVESEAELQRIEEVASALGVRAPISLRINPDIDAGTHPYISTGLKQNKFGIAIDDALRLYREAAEMAAVDVIGIDCHIGSQLVESAPFAAAMERVIALVDQLAEEGIVLNHIDMGGGLGITYGDEAPPLPGDYAAPLLHLLGGRDLTLIIEPGRAIVGNAGILLTRVEYLKPHGELNFAIVDAAMNDLARPSLYQAWQEIIAVTPHKTVDPKRYDIVGPVCESGDFLGKGRLLALRKGDLLAVRSAGAYGFSMSSNYNSRPRAAEVLVDGAQLSLIRRRETVAELFALESIAPL
ncbi:MAG: diaminopimelate decarboxylase [Gammaproteobacteria bacterium]|nr:diaminopimelate decarboxylase [Gammaproteobacteria bacterium]